MDDLPMLNHRTAYFCKRFPIMLALEDHELLVDRHATGREK